MNEPTYLYGNWLTKYQHIERLGNEDCEGLLEGEVIVQEKLDGANLTVAYDQEKGLIIASRNNVISVGGSAVSGFNGAIEYILSHPSLSEYLRQESSKGQILRGEWLVKHSLNYSKEHYSKFYLFDIQCEGVYFEHDVVKRVADFWNIPAIPIDAHLTNPKLEDLLQYVNAPSQYGATHREGIVVKRHDFRNRWGRATWGKLISADFQEKHKLAMGACRHDPIELKFAAEFATSEFVLKTIHQIEDTVGRKLVITDMPRVLGQTWNILFQEELWGFVKHEHLPTINFRSLRSLVEKAAREHALAYFNGVISV